MKRSIIIGNGFHEGKVPFQRGLKAAQAALHDIGDLPPVLALVNGGEKGEGRELLRGIQSGLGGCPLFGLPASRPFLREIAPHFARSRRAARVILIASNHMKVKVGVSREGTGRIFVLSQYYSDSSSVGMPQKRGAKIVADHRLSKTVNATTIKSSRISGSLDVNS